MTYETNHPAAPVAWVLCADERMFRFFEIELAHLGLVAVAAPSADQALCLAVADTDQYPVDELLSDTVPPNCPLVAFGYTPVELSKTRGVWLRRPFPLSVLEYTLRQLSAEAVRTASPLSQRQESPCADRGAALLCFDASTASVSVGEHRVSLTPAEWAILRLLYDRRGKPVSHEELDALLGGGGNSVEVYICRLRRKIEKPLGRRLIHTVRGQGYRVD